MTQKNEEIREKHCKYCRIYGERLTREEMYDCTVCYGGLRKGDNVDHILKKYKMGWTW